MKSTVAVKNTKAHYRLLALAGLGGALEFLDFTLYALFAPYISQNFFPQQEHLIALLNTFAIFAVGYFARPLGGIVFGHFGDTLGRKKTFVVSAFMMAIATLLMGCLPSYQQIGMLAPLLLLALRIVQGISVGGEVPGATVFILEHFPRNKRGLAVGLIFMGVTLGNVIGSSLGYLLSSRLSAQSMMLWGWRVPFFAGFILGLVAYQLRKKSIETPIFIEILQENAIHVRPLAKVINTNFKELLKGIGLTALSAVTIFLLIYLPSYSVVQKYYKMADLYLINIMNFFIFAIFTAFFGMLSDKINRKKLMQIGALLAVVSGYFLFSLLLTGTYIGLLIFCFGITITVAMVNGCYGCAIAELFPAPIRYSGMGIAYNTGLALFGGFAPFLMTGFFQWTQSDFAPYYLFAVFGVITFAMATLLPSSSHPAQSKGPS